MKEPEPVKTYKGYAWGAAIGLPLKDLLLNEKPELHNRDLHISGLLNKEKVNIGNVKVDIALKEVDIQDRKVDIENALSEISLMGIYI